MTIHDLRRLLERARGGESPSGTSIDAVELQGALDLAVEGQGEVLSPAAAALLRDLAEVDLTPAARKLLREVARDKLPLPTAGAPLAQPGAVVAELNGVEGRVVGLMPSGALRLDEATSSDALIEAAASIVIGQVDTKTNPFALVTSTAALDRVIDTHRRMLEQVREGKRLNAESDYARRHARAALLAVSRLAAERLVELGGKGAADKLAATLVRDALREPHPALKRFELYRLLASRELGAAPAAKAAEKAVFPSEPPYAKWRADGVLRVQAYCDDDGAPWARQVSLYLDELGMKVKDGHRDDPSKPIVMVKDLSKEGGGFERVEVTLAPAPSKHEPPSLFARMGDPGVDVIIYSGHAGYGQRVEAALRAGVEGTGDGKLLMLFQCWGVGNLDSIGRAFPDAQVFTSIDATIYFSDESATIRAFEGFARGASWESILSNVRFDAKTAESGYSKLYFAPSTRSVVEGRIDWDKDGTVERKDSVYLEPTSELLTRAATGFNPTAQALPAYAFDGSRLNYALKDASLTLRYAQFGLSPVPPGHTEPLVLGPSLLDNGGFFTPAVGDERAVVFAPVTIDGQTRLRVRQSARFAHVQGAELDTFLAFELGKQLAAWSGKTAEEQVAYGMLFYQQSLTHRHKQWEAYAALQTDALQHQLFLRRYGLPELPFVALRGLVSDEHDDLAAPLVEEIVAKLAPWAKDAAASPRPVGAPARFDFRESLGAGQWDLDAAKVARFARSIAGHEQDEVISVTPRSVNVRGPWLLFLRAPDGGRRLVAFDLEPRSKRPTLAHDLGAVDLRHAALEMMAVNRDAWAPLLWPDRARVDARAAAAQATANGNDLLRLVEEAMASGATLRALAAAAAERVQATGGDTQRLGALFGYRQDFLRDVYSSEDVRDLDALLDELGVNNHEDPGHYY